jgi:hypothetical protein
MPSPYPVTRGVSYHSLTQHKLSPGFPGRFSLATPLLFHVGVVSLFLKNHTLSQTQAHT